MKLFSRAAKFENSVFEENVFFAYGPLMTYDDDTNFHPTVYEDSAHANGFYIKIELPCAFRRQYLDSSAFTIGFGPCRKAILIRKRVPKHQRKAIWSVTTAWTPIRKKT